jgi:hypothetical protein
VSNAFLYALGEYYASLGNLEERDKRNIYDRLRDWLAMATDNFVEMRIAWNERGIGLRCNFPGTQFLALKALMPRALMYDLLWEAKLGIHLCRSDRPQA